MNAVEGSRVSCGRGYSGCTLAGVTVAPQLVMMSAGGFEDGEPHLVRCHAASRRCSLLCACTK